MTKYTVQGVGTIELGQKQFIAAGGEGKVYGMNQTAYKVYDDPKDMLPVAKIQELSVLTHPNIIKPERLLLDSHNRNVGYSMRLVKDGTVMCQLFTKAFKQRNNIDDKITLNLIKKFHELVAHCHDKGILVIDLNEFNYMVDSKFKEVYAIDVNSYQTPSYPATVIMPSVRDRHVHGNKFNKNTDWFSWGIVAFQMLIGLHPYKGNHPDFENLSPEEKIDARMLKNVSVFNKKATYPKICPPFDIIPSALKRWFHDVFEKGERTPPPLDYEVVKKIAAVTAVIGSRQFNIQEFMDYNEEILDVHFWQGHRLVLTNNAIHYNKKTCPIPTNDVRIVFSPKMSIPYAVYIENDRLKVLNINTQTFLPESIPAENVMECDGRVYFRKGIDVSQLEFMEFSGTVKIAGKKVGNMLDVPGTTKFCDGAVIQNLLGSYYVSLFPKPGRCYQLELKELEKYQIINAKYENNVLVVIAHNLKLKTNDRLVYRIDKEFAGYDCRVVPNVAMIDLNFTVNDAGICVLITEEEKLELFSNKLASNVKIFDDPSIESTMRLCHDGTKIMFYRGSKLYTLAMSK